MEKFLIYHLIYMIFYYLYFSNNLVAKINEIRIDKKVDGMSEVRDESDQNEPMRIVIDLKKDADKDLIINYLLKNTDLQVPFSFNMVAIVNRKPMTIGILPMLDAYISFQREVIIRRTEFDLAVAKKQIHITCFIHIVK